MHKSFKKQSIQQLQRHIRVNSKLTELVFLSAHAQDQMRARKVLQSEIYECLREGVIALQPEEDMKTGHLICCMERYVCGRNLAVCVALDDNDPDLIVVTVFVVKNKGK